MTEYDWVFPFLEQEFPDESLDLCEFDFQRGLCVAIGDGEPIHDSMSTGRRYPMVRLRDKDFDINACENKEQELSRLVAQVKAIRSQTIH